MLYMKNVSTHYGKIQALHEVNLEVQRGEIVTLIGANGAGKTTLLMTLCGDPRATTGSIRYEGEELTGLTTAQIMRKDIAIVPEGRRVFSRLTVEENLLTGAYLCKDGQAAIRRDVEMVYHYFPRLKERRDAQAGYTSGGEQQMTALGRALMAKPKMILLDEPSMGLAPQLVEEIFDIVKDLNEKENVSFLLAEQNTNMALRYAGYGYVLENGRVVMDGAAATLRDNEDIKEFYLGLDTGGRKSFRNVKHYRRRKRWLV